MPHHVTQRGNARQNIFCSDAERQVYLELLRQQLRLHDLGMLGYCLMSNHVHLILVPRKVESLALALKGTHGKYASFWNAAHLSNGHVWQGRFYSCPLDQPYLWIALRYVELNPVRAGLAAAGAEWAWSSASVHSGTAASGAGLDLGMWARRWSVASWREYLHAGETTTELQAVRKSTHTGRPLGATDFVRDLEIASQRQLQPQKGGRPSKRRFEVGELQLR
jgi:putative transposase